MWKSLGFIRKGIFATTIAASAWALASPVTASTDERVIKLKGTTNTRDIGGYQTANLETILPGQIIRSDKLSKLTAADFKKLEDLGLKTVIDLRTQEEFNHSPTKWKGDNPPQFFHFPVGNPTHEWFRAQRKMMKKNRFTEEQSLAHMVEGYRMIAELGPASYEQVMEVVMDESNWPILIHCNAGKDRAGVAVALIMESLGVERETIMEEFLLTNEVSRIEDKAIFLAKQSKNNARGDRYSKGTPASAWLPIVGVRSEMLEAFYASVDETYGSMDAFLVELGVDQDARDSLVASLTTPTPGLASAN